MSADVLTPLREQNFAITTQEEDEYDADVLMQANDNNIFGDNFGAESSSSTRNDDNLQENTTPEKEDEKQEEEEMVVDNNNEYGRGDAGGLQNLGNTCYLNSAIQMLASSDKFIEALESQIPPSLSSEDDIDDEKKNKYTTKLKLRDEFLTLVKALRTETVNPKTFKETIDELSSLFVGYRQQDSHEFLTTVLELLDESYKPPSQKREDKEVKEVENNDDHINNNNNEDAIIEAEKDKVPPSNPLRRAISLADLKLDEISTLLHGDAVEEDNRKGMNGTRSSDLQNCCKLVGGRAVISEKTEDSCTILKQNGEERVLPSRCLVCEESNSNDNNNDRQEQQSSPSPVDTHFGTEIRSRLTCDSCKYTRSQIEKYMFLSIDIHDGTTNGDDANNNSIEEGLRNFFAPEKLELKCEKCFCESATQTTEITRLPNALVLHFKRFIVDISPDYSNITYRKNRSEVSFPEELHCGGIHDVLTEFLAEDYEDNATIKEEEMDTDENDNYYDHHQERRRRRTYSIQSVVNHIGSSASCGHYTADSCRCPINNESSDSNNVKEWTRYNDSYVTKITPEEAISPTTAKTAYIVMYELEDNEEDDDEDDEYADDDEQKRNRVCNIMSWV